MKFLKYKHNLHKFSLIGFYRRLVFSVSICTVCANVCLSIFCTDCSIYTGEWLCSTPCIVHCTTHINRGISIYFNYFHYKILYCIKMDGGLSSLSPKEFTPIVSQTITEALFAAQMYIFLHRHGAMDTSIEIKANSNALTNVFVIRVCVQSIHLSLAKLII